MYESKQPSSKAASKPDHIDTGDSADENWLLVGLVEALEKIDLSNKLTELNKGSMLGSDGLRILF